MEENKLKKKVIHGGVIFLGIVLVFTVLSKTIYTFLLPKVTIEKVSSGKIETKILASGEIGYDKQMMEAKKVAVKAPIEGQIIECYVQEGQKVQKGDALLKLKGTVQETVVKEQEAQRAESKINQSTYNRQKKDDQTKITELNKKLQEKKSKLNSNEKSYDEVELENQIQAKEDEVAANEGLYEAGVISTNEYSKAKEELVLLRKKQEDLVKSNKEKIKGEIEELNEKLRDAQNEMASLDDKIALEKVKLSNQSCLAQEEIVVSPISGIVYEVDMAVGASALNHDQLMVIIPNDIPITLSFNVNDKETDKLKVGEEVTWINNKERQAATIMKKKYDDKTGETIVTCEVAKELAKTIVEDYKNYKQVDVEAIDTSEPYDLLVSSSAIVHEGNSAYVYTIEKVETFFDTTYIVHKNLVSVIKEGDYMSAVTGTIKAQDQIVKTTNKLLSEGSEVSKA